MAGMERFTQRARRVLSLAHQEAERSHQENIGTEHLLLGLIEEDGGVAGQRLPRTWIGIGTRARNGWASFNRRTRGQQQARAGEMIRNKSSDLQWMKPRISVIITSAPNIFCLVSCASKDRRWKCFANSA